MSFAPYTNDNLNGQPAIKGQFRNSETNFFFEFCNRTDTDLSIFAAEFPHRVFVGNNGETRCARVMKTVAYIVTDENSDGSLVVEKWKIKEHKFYA